MNITCGLEIHQQLNCKKLYSDKENKVDDLVTGVVSRKLRAVVGETGEVDIAAAQAAKKGKTYIYEYSEATAGLIELDEAPPGQLRQEALETALLLGKMMNANFVDEVQPMRKTVVDGSNTSGFQRTALVAYNGKIKSSKGDISIPSIIVEEDSARIIHEDHEKSIFRLDRLGVPLLEISTGPDIHSGEQCQEVAEKIGSLLRSTGRVNRGLGTIRQDVNVSIDGGNRVEIKGAQDLKMIPTLVDVEANRQFKLLHILKELKLRKVTAINPQIHDITPLLSKNDSKVIQGALLKGGHVLAIALPGFKGLIGMEIQPAKRLGTEFSDYAKQAAGVKGIFHSDELPNYGITPNDIEKINASLKCGQHDAFVLVAAEKSTCEKALQAVIHRAQLTLHGVPKEVRRANPDGTSTFMRAMPGAARLYPETDVLPVRVTKKMIDALKMPELIEDKMKRYEKMGLGKDLAELTAKSDKSGVFDQFVNSFKELKAGYIAEIVMSADKTIKRQFNVDIEPSDEDYCELFRALEHGEVSKESVLEILKEKKPVKDILGKYKVLSDKELKQAIEKIIEKNKGVAVNALLGKAMAELRGKASGQKIAELVKELASKTSQ